MRKLLTFFLGAGTASTAVAHEIGGHDGILQSFHATLSLHHWQGLALLLCIAFVLVRVSRRKERGD